MKMVKTLKINHRTGSAILRQHWVERLNSLTQAEPFDADAEETAQYIAKQAFQEHVSLGSMNSWESVVDTAVGGLWRSLEAKATARVKVRIRLWSSSSHRLHPLFRLLQCHRSWRAHHRLPSSFRLLHGQFVPCRQRCAKRRAKGYQWTAAAGWSHLARAAHEAAGSGGGCGAACASHCCSSAGAKSA